MLSTTYVRSIKLLISPLFLQLVTEATVGIHYKGITNKPLCGRVGVVPGPGEINTISSSPKFELFTIDIIFIDTFYYVLFSKSIKKSPVLQRQHHSDHFSSGKQTWINVGSNVYNINHLKNLTL